MADEEKFISSITLPNNEDYPVRDIDAARSSHTHGNINNDGTLTYKNRLVWTTSAGKIFAGDHYASATSVAINSIDAPSETFYVNGSAQFNIGTSNDGTNSKRFIIQGNGRSVSIGGQGIQAFASGTTAKKLYILDWGGDLGIGENNKVGTLTFKSTTANISWDTASVTGSFIFYTSAGFNYAGIQSASTDSARNVWFSNATSRGIPVYNANFTYNPATPKLALGAANITGSTSTTASTDAFSILTLGNNKNKTTTDAHSQGKIILYSGGTAAHTIVGTDTNTAYTLTLPDATGTIALTSSDITGNAGSATKLETARTIWGKSFDGTGNITGDMTDVGESIKLLSGKSQFNFLTSAGGAALGKFGGIGINSSYANVDLTNYVLDVWGKSRFTNIITLYRQGTTTNNYATGIVFNNKDTTTGKTETAKIYQYNSHSTDGYGSHLFISTYSSIIIAAGECGDALQTAYCSSTARTSENIYLSADLNIYAEANANTAANRIGFLIDTSGHIIPTKAEAANDNMLNLGASSNRWSKVFAHTLDGTVLKLHLGSAQDPATDSRARIEFDYAGSLGTQAVSISYTPNDSYRSPAGLKIMGNGNTTGSNIASPAWFEVEGSIFANGGVENKGYRVPHTGNADGSVGNTTTPVYVDAGQIKEGTALKDLAYIAKPSSDTTTTYLRGDGSWVSLSDMGLSNALHFIGITSTELSNGSTETTLTAKTTGSLSKTTGFVDGDVVMDGDLLREYVWSGSAWRLLGITVSSIYTLPATTANNTWISLISQGTDGKITATTDTLVTTGTWSGKAAKLTDLNTNDNASNSTNWRKVWISYADGTTGRPALSDNLAYLTSTDTLKSPHFLAQHVANSSGEFHITYSTTIDYWMGVGTGNGNHGIYDVKLSAWVLSAGTDNNWKLRAEGVGASNNWIAYPLGGSYHTESSEITGALKIILPLYKSNTMISFDVHIYTYEGDNASRVIYHISGYELSANGWYGPVSKVYTEGTGTYANLKVRYGVDNSKTYITIGETTTKWSYPLIAISNVHVGYKNYTFDYWSAGWSISFVDTIPATVASERENVNIQSINITGNAATITAGESTGNYSRPVWFSYHENGNVVNGKLGYNNNFIYNPSSGVLQVGSTTAGSIWCGKATANTEGTGERDIGVRNGSGRLYLYASDTTTGNKGLYAYKADQSTGGAILTINLSNLISTIATLACSPTITGTLTLSRTQDVVLTGTEATKPALIIGGAYDNQQHLELDGNEIQSKNGKTTASDLYLNNLGGSVSVGSASSSTFKVLYTSSASSTTSGALLVAGGAGIGGKLYIGDATSIAGDLNISKANSQTSLGVYVEHTNPNNDTSLSKKVALMIGGTTGNGGLYDSTAGKWIVYSAPNGNVTLNGNLNSNNSFYTFGLLYYSGLPTIGTADGNATEGSVTNTKIWCYPKGGTATTTVANVLVIRTYWNASYFHDIFISPNKEEIWHRSVANGTANNWRKILDSFNTYAKNSDGTAVAVTCGTDATLATINGVTVKINVSTPTAADVGAAASDHDHDDVYLKLSGGKMTGRIHREGKSTSWNKGRDNALVAISTLSGYSPFASVKTNSGSWDIGAYNNNSYKDDLIFSYVPDTLYNGTNTTPSTQIKFLEDGHIVGDLDGNASTATNATNDSDGNAINTTYIKKVTSTDNAIVKFNGTNGLVLDTSVTIDENNNISTTGNYIESAAGRVQKVLLLPAGAWSGYAENTWYRCCKIAGKYHYANFIILLSGAWNAGAPAMATISVLTLSTNAKMSILHCSYNGIIKTIRLVNNDGWWLDVQINKASTSTTAQMGAQTATFIGNVVVTDINAVATPTTDTTAPKATLTLKTKYYDNDTEHIDHDIEMSGQIKTSFKESIAMGSYCSLKTTIGELIEEVRYSSGCAGSVNITTAYTKNSVTIPTNWYNFVYVPHRTGGLNGAANNDNCNYGVLYLHNMTNPSKGDFVLSYNSSSITLARMNALFTEAPTDGQVLIADGTGGGIKSKSLTRSDITWSNNTLYPIGDDIYIGDVNLGGHLGLKSKSASYNTGLIFIKQNTSNDATTSTTGGRITWDGTKFSITSTTAIDASISGNAATATTATNINITTAAPTSSKKVGYLAISPAVTGSNALAAESSVYVYNVVANSAITATYLNVGQGGTSYGGITLHSPELQNFHGDIITTTLTANRTYTLPDTTGTLALTSNLDDYLPLSGGTMTGAINRYYNADSTDALILVRSNNKNVYVFLAGHAGNATDAVSSSYALEYHGSGDAPNNTLILKTLYNSTVTDAITIDQSGKVTLSRTNTANSPMLKITDTSAATVAKSGAWMWGLSHTVTNLATGGHTCLMTGVAEATNKSAVLEFNYNHATTTTLNTVGLGLYGNNNLLTINGNGLVTITKTTDATSTTNGVLYVKGGISVVKAIYMGGQLTIANDNAGAIYLNRTSGPNWIYSTNKAIAFCVHSELNSNYSGLRINEKSIDGYNDELSSLGTNSVQWSATYSKNYVVDKNVTLQYNSTDQALEFVFA